MKQARPIQLRRRVWIVCLMGTAFLAHPQISLAQQNASEILDRVIEALGGDAYREVTDITTRGRLYRFQRGDLVGLEIFHDIIKFPDKERTEFGENGDLVRINNGSRGWNINDGTVEAQRPEQIDVFWEEFKVSLDYLLRFVVNSEDSTLQYVGREMINFKRADVLEIRDEDRTRINLYVDRESGLLIKKTVRRLDDPRIHEEVYSNYHEFQNVLTPLLVDRYTNGLQTSQIRFDDVQYNTGVSDAVFVAVPD